MASLTTLVNEPVIHAVGWALIHSLWQGTLIALLLALTLRCFRGASSQLRYLLSCVALVSMVGLMIATGLNTTDVTRNDGRLVNAQIDVGPVGQVGPVVVPAALPEISIDETRVQLHAAPVELIEGCLPWIVAAWLAGLLLVSCRMCFGWASLRRLRHRGSTPVSEALRSRVVELCRVMGIKRAVVVFSSTRVAAPMVVGWLRPVILLPVSCITGLSSQQLEAILAHELAHIARYDYLVNLLQCVAETLLFYHPAVWWIGRAIRREREQCCDDRVVQLTGDRADYARALLHLAETAPPYRGRLSLASQGGELSSRVRRLLGREPQQQLHRWSTGLWTALASLCVAGVLVMSAQAGGDSTKTADEIAPITVSQATDTPTGDNQDVIKQRIIEIPYQKLIAGDPNYNIVIRPDDIIKVSEPTQSPFVYINGLVKRPGAYTPPTPNTLTLKQLVASAGGVPGSEPVFIKLIRRVKPDQTETMHFAWDDLMEGWTQDAFLSPNDAIFLSHEPGPEDEAAKERRRLREALENTRKNLNDLQVLLQNTADKDSEDSHQSLPLRIDSLQREEERIAKELTVDPEQVDSTILPAPDPMIIGEAPQPEDLLVRPLPNRARAGDRINLVASNADRLRYQTTFVREIDAQGMLPLPGITSVPFVGRPIDDIEAEVLRKMQGHPDYSQTEIVTINLPDNWAFTAIGKTISRQGVHSLPHAGFRLLEALGRLGDIPGDTQTVLVIRQPVVTE